MKSLLSDGAIIAVGMKRERELHRMDGIDGIKKRANDDERQCPDNEQMESLGDSTDSIRSSSLFIAEKKQESRSPNDADSARRVGDSQSVTEEVWVDTNGQKWRVRDQLPNDPRIDEPEAMKDSISAVNGSKDSSESIGVESMSNGDGLSMESDKMRREIGGNGNGKETANGFGRTEVPVISRPSSVYVSALSLSLSVPLYSMVHDLRSLFCSF